MSDPAAENNFLRGLEIEVEAELTMAESSRPEEVVDEPVAEWPFDPMEVERYEVELRGLLGAVEAMEDGTGQSTADGGNP